MSHIMYLVIALSLSPVAADITELKDVATSGNSTTVAEGESFQLLCIADGWPQPSLEVSTLPLPPPSIPWKIIYSPSALQWLHPNGSLVETGNVYTNLSPTVYDTGNYTCRAFNGVIDTHTHLVLVKVCMV